ncbi:MAG: AAA family ATPase [Methanomassiliicoccales archaeon]|nr:AAA family ATPase [Methanomassiliicoccales archaeon]
MSTIIAIAGKGGVGKTTIAALLIRALHERTGMVIMAVDADPNSNLGEKLGIKVERTIGDLREDLLRKSEEVPIGQSKQDFVRYQMQLATVEGSSFDLLTMGRPEGPGCYCFINNILRTFIDQAMEKYDHVVIDNEAGMEHLSRRTTKRMDAFLVVSDDTKTGVETAVRILKLAQEMGIEVGRATLILNKVKGDVRPSVKDLVQASPFGHVVILPHDRDVENTLIEGRSILELAGTNPFYEKIKALALEL